MIRPCVCPAQVSCASCALPCPPFPCSGLSPPPSTTRTSATSEHALSRSRYSTHVLPRETISGASQVPECISSCMPPFMVNSAGPSHPRHVTRRSSAWLCRRFCGTRPCSDHHSVFPVRRPLLGCVGVSAVRARVAGTLACPDALVLASACVTTLADRNWPFEAISTFRDSRHPLRPTRYSVYASSVLFARYLTPPQTQHSIRVSGSIFPDGDLHPARHIRLRLAR